MTLAQWPMAERPREKLMSRGCSSLSDAELLAIFLRTGVSGSSSVDLAFQLLNEFGSLAKVLSATKAEFCAVAGLGPVKYAMLQAVQELAKRHLFEQIQEVDVLTSSTATRNYLRAKFRSFNHEVFSCLFLNNQHHVVKFEELFTGTIDGAAVYPREVVKRCLHLNAAAVIFAHNHPSGVAEPSQADIAITRKLITALATVEVRVLDHLVIGANDVVSFAERRLL